jgi:ATP-binding cassette subfamily B protein
MNAFNLIKPYFLRRRFSVLIGLLCLITVDVLQLFIPRVIKSAVDDLTFLRTSISGLGRYAVYIIALAGLIGLFRFLWRHWLMGLSREIEEGLRNSLFFHIQTLSASYFNQMKTGDIMAHATNDIHHIRMAASMGLVALTDAVLLGTATIGFMAYIHVRLTCYVILPMPFIVLCARFFSRRMHHWYEIVQAGFSDLTETVRERYAGIRIIKAYTREADSVAALEKLSTDYVDNNLKLARITGLFFPMMTFFSNLSLTLVLFMGGRETLYGDITPGGFVAFISYLGLLTWPMMALGWLINLMQRGKASLERVNKILQTAPEIKEHPDARPFDGLKKEIVFENVRFAYGTDSPQAIDRITLRIKAGGILGIVGPPGAGKTTLLSLVPRIYDPSEGRILMDGTDIRHLRLNDIRAQIGFVPQEPFLFAGTIRDNITFGNKDISESALDQAVEDAALQGTIRSFPKGLDTVSGEKGVVLSGGQKQRVALARAFLHQAPILLLDDPISQVDMETGTAIVRSIRKTARERTVIIVSHRLSAVRFADQIIVIKDGQPQESGSHDELMGREGYYSKTFRLQEIEEKFQTG